MNKLLKRTTFSAALSILFMSTQAMAVPIFFDDFESGLGKWTTPGSSQIVSDPLNSGNHALNFNNLGSGGDSYTARNLAAGTYHLSLDILGTCRSGNCGGFVGINDAVGEQWLIGDSSYSTPNLLVNNGTWQHIDVMFTARGSTPFQLKLEDFIPSAISRDVYFDNICVTSQVNDSGCSASRSNVPEPASLALLGIGIAGLGFGRRKKN